MVWIHTGAVVARMANERLREFTFEHQIRHTMRQLMSAVVLNRSVTITVKRSVPIPAAFGINSGIIPYCFLCKFGRACDRLGIHCSPLMAVSIAVRSVVSEANILPL